MKRNIAHIMTAVITIFNLITYVKDNQNFYKNIWGIENIVMNIIIVVFLIRSLRENPKSSNDSMIMFIVAVFSTNLPNIISLFGGIGIYSDISILRKIGMVMTMITVPWYIYSVFCLGKNLTILPEANDLVTDGAYRFSRHPLYITYIVWAVIQNLTFQSYSVLVISIVQITLFITRALNEEKTLTNCFEEYENYRNNVSWIGRKK